MFTAERDPFPVRRNGGIACRAIWNAHLFDGFGRGIHLIQPEASVAPRAERYAMIREEGCIPHIILRACDLAFSDSSLGPRCGDIPDPQAISTLHLADERKQFAVRRRDRLFRISGYNRCIVPGGCRRSGKKTHNSRTPAGGNFGPGETTIIYSSRMEPIASACKRDNGPRPEFADGVRIRSGRERERYQRSEKQAIRSDDRISCEC